MGSARQLAKPLDRLKSFAKMPVGPLEKKLADNEGFFSGNP
jgi:hypothetical protein